MGAYIKGLSVPTICSSCLFFYDDSRLCMIVCSHVPSCEKPDWCPMVEVKEPHGRLIDEDEVLDTVKRLKSFPWGDDRGHRIPLLFEPYEVERIIKHSPTVIERSE